MLKLCRSLNLTKRCSMGVWWKPCTALPSSTPRWLCGRETVELTQKALRRTVVEQWKCEPTYKGALLYNKWQCLLLSNSRSRKYTAIFFKEYDSVCIVKMSLKLHKWKRNQTPVSLLKDKYSQLINQFISWIRSLLKIN